MRQLQNDPLTADYRSAWGKTGEPGAAITGTMQGIETNITHPNMNISERTSMRQRLKAVQGELIEGLDAGMGAPTTPPLERLVHILDWLRVEELVADGCGVGRPPRERFALANAFIAKVVLRLPTTVALIDRLKVDRTLRRICGFAWFKRLPDEATFSRAFAQFAQERLAERAHEALIKEQLSEQLIGHLSRDGTDIEVRERPVKVAEFTQPVAGLLVPEQSTVPMPPDHQQPGAPDTTPSVKHRRGRPRRGEVRAPKEPSRIQRQRQQGVQQMLDEIPKDCDRGAKCNAQGYKNSWNGYKLHIDTADCGVPISAVLTSASVHDSQVAVPLSRLSAQRVTSLYDVMDAAYCSAELREDSCELGHVPLIDHNPRGGVKLEFARHEAERYKERTVAERMNARLKDEFGGNNVWVRGPVKVMSHLMFGVLVLSADQFMRILQ